MNDDKVKKYSLIGIIALIGVFVVFGIYLLLSGSPSVPDEEEETPSAEVEKPSTSKEDKEEKDPVQKEDSSILTDADKSSLVSMINSELSAKYTSNKVQPVSKNSVKFTQNNGTVTATGNAVLTENGTPITVPFTFEFKKNNSVFTTVNKSMDDKNIDTNKENKPTTETTTASEDLELQSSSDITVNSGVTANVSCTSGHIRIVVTDDSGTETVIMDENGPVSGDYSADLTAGSYTISLYSSPGSGWNWSFNCH